MSKKKTKIFFIWVQIQEFIFVKKTINMNNILFWVKKGFKKLCFSYICEYVILILDSIR